MADDTVSAIEQYLLSFLMATAHVSHGADKLNQIWGESSRTDLARADAAAAALSLEHELERLRSAHRQILAAADEGALGSFQRLAQRATELEATLADAIRMEDRPGAILGAVFTLAQGWTNLAAAVQFPRSMPPAASTLYEDPGFQMLAGSSASTLARLYNQTPVANLAALAGSTRERASPAPAAGAARLAARFPATRIMKAIGKSALGIVPNPDWRTLRERPPHIDPAVEPRLQVALARKKSGVQRMALASTDADEISVIAEVDDLQRWEGLSEVRVGISLGPTQSDKNVFIVTGRIPVDRIETVRKQDFVRSLSATQTVLPALEATTRDMQVQPGLLPAGVSPDGGAGVVVGIVDFGCDFAHQNFLKPDGSTRIEAIWNQAGTASGPSQVQYGRLHTRGDIDAALADADPYRALGYGSRTDPSFMEGTHGTHVMDIAAGNGRGSGVPGCATESAIIFVDLEASDIAWQGPAAVGQSFGDSVRVLEAVSLIFELAGDRPCVVNLSLGTNGGPHDGTTLVEQGFDRLIKTKPNRAIVLAAANSQADNIHTAGDIPRGGAADLVWKTRDSLAGPEMEIWIPRDCSVAAELIAPDGTSLGVAEPGGNLSVGTDDDVVVYVGSQLDNPGNHDNMIGIFVAGGVGAGEWTIRLINRGDNAVAYHAWIERLDDAQSSFDSPSPGYTLGSISCGMETICVGSYDAHKTTRPLSYFSSTGPTRDGREKPEVSAPGHYVLAARSGSGDKMVRMSGTSMAAPAVSGLVALVLAEAKRQGHALSSRDIRDVLTRGTDPGSPAGKSTWDPGYGYGCACSLALSLL
jgi:subtilisin family serine protease